MQDPPTALEPPAKTAAPPPQEAVPDAPARKPRDPTFDILKGISILEVVTHHVLSSSMRKFAVRFDAEWWAMATLSRILHFAVPTFLLVSAVLLARSVASKPKPDWRKFALRRVQRTLAPYLVWTVIYIAFRIWILKAPSDLAPPATWPGLAAGLPAVLDPGRLLTIVFWGKAYYHIYFMVVLLQFSVIFPFLVAGLRRVRLGFDAVVLVAIAAQMAAFLAQRHVYSVRYPGSTVLWYLMPVLVGLWIGLRWSEWEDVWRRRRWHIGAMALGGLAVYLPIALIHYTGRPLYGMAHNVAISFYCLGVALLLLAFSRRLATTRAGSVLQRVGDRSIMVFLIHPMVLFFLGGPRFTNFVSLLPLPTLFLWAATIGITWVLSEAGRRLRLDGVLYGR